MDLPVGRIVAAELVAELLAQVVLGPAARAVARLSDTAGSAAVARAGRLFLRRRDEPLLAHLREHEMAALERAVVVASRARAPTAPASARR